MPRESRKARAERARRIAAKLFEAYPDARCALEHQDPFELLCATQLSAQCTDKVVNTVTPALFARYPDAASLAKARPADLERIIRPTGFYRSKAKSLIGMARRLVEHHGGRVPGTLAELVRLPGVGRKTANVVLGNAFDTPGLVVDTHVGRLAQRMRLTRETDPVKVERDLMELIPERDWTQLSHALIFHGRRICSARSALCERCPVYADCPFPRQRARTAPVKTRKTTRKRSPRRRASRA
ncbi:MAG: endonuclease III [Myxococcota bacterium]